MNRIAEKDGTNMISNLEYQKGDQLYRFYDPCSAIEWFTGIKKKQGAILFIGILQICKCNYDFNEIMLRYRFSSWRLYMYYSLAISSPVTFQWMEFSSSRFMYLHVICVVLFTFAQVCFHRSYFSIVMSRKPVKWRSGEHFISKPIGNSENNI